MSTELVAVVVLPLEMFSITGLVNCHVLVIMWSCGTYRLIMWHV